MTDRLFHCLPTPTERADRRARWRRQQSAMFDVPADKLDTPSLCAACGAPDADVCTCARTGATAGTLDLPTESETP